MSRPARVKKSILAIAAIAAVVSAGLLAPTTSIAKVRYAGHVRFHHTSCCGIQSAVFKVFGRSNVHYRVCQLRPNGGKKCRNLQTGESGQPSRTTFLNQDVGTFKIIWKVEGRIRDTDDYFVAVEGV